MANTLLSIGSRSSGILVARATDSIRDEWAYVIHTGSSMLLIDQEAAVDLVNELVERMTDDGALTPEQERHLTYLLSRLHSES